MLGDGFINLNVAWKHSCKTQVYDYDSVNGVTDTDLDFSSQVVFSSYSNLRQNARDHEQVDFKDIVLLLNFIQIYGSYRCWF